MTSQHLFRKWISVVRQEAPTWVNIDPQLCTHMASLSHNDLSNREVRIWIKNYVQTHMVWNYLSMPKNNDSLWYGMDEQLHHSKLVRLLIHLVWAIINDFPDSKVHGASMGPTWDPQDPGGPHVGHMNWLSGLSFKEQLTLSVSKRFYCHNYSTG